MDQKLLLEIIEKAQHGDEEAKNQLIKTMIDEGYDRRMSRYLYLNRLVEPDEVRSEFWLGVARAIPKVKPIGNPLQFLSQNGLWQIVSTMRRRIRRQVSYACLNCGKHDSLTSRVLKGGCPSCGSMSIETHEIVKSIEITNEPPVPSVKSNDFIQRFREKLTVRESEVLDLMDKGYDRDNSTNYLKEIGDVLGVSAPCVSIYLKRIRTKLRAFMEEK